MKRVTGKDVAARAGVTAATVSYVLSGSDKVSVSDATRQRVLEAARELGYVPDMAAKSLRRRESKTIGVAIEKNLATPRYAWALQGMVQAAARLGYHITICRDRMADNGMMEYLSMYYERLVDGVVFVGTDNVGPDAETIARVERDRIPFVALDCQLDGAPFGTVDFDYQGGAYAVTEYLLKRKACRVAYIRPEVDTAQERLREEGVRSACADLGAPEPFVGYVPIGRATLASYDADRPAQGAATQNGTTADITRTDYSRLAYMVHASLADEVRDGDLIICSWAGWTGIMRQVSGYLLSLFGDLASSTSSAFSADAYAVMPNYEAGEACVTQLVGQIGGRPPEATVLPLRCQPSEFLREF